MTQTKATKAKKFEDMIANMNLKELDGFYSTLARGNTNGSMNDWLEAIERKVDEHIAKHKRDK